MNTTDTDEGFTGQGRSITLFLDDDIRDDIDIIASVNGISRSKAARALLRFGICVTLSEDPDVAALVGRLAQPQN
ncbi:hypothetical protein MKK55_15895 [Methylobacterium sp. J-059]|uniref:hypothetical protein n=1 Tax=Methylobacterium sp. J-059 TaxID=2836643 RepID=UPI001FBA0E22|nr:hypothetical protein [Methylobacterium sp. J-059]MCJ2040414.1 hypothetical protein [Methylobacterium sp. J-059]